MTKSNTFGSILTGLLVSSVALSQPSYAQTANQAADSNATGSTDSIVRMSALEVTTTQGHGYVATESAEGLKSHSSLMDIPQVDFVITSDLIKDVGFENDTEMLSYFGSGGGSDPGEGAKLRGGGSSSAVYIDEFPEHAQWSDPATFDSVEMIKGDTEAVYMLNSGLGGIILKSRKKPLPYQQDMVSASVNSWGLLRTVIDSTGPVGEISDAKIKYRLIAAYQDGSGYFTNYYDDRETLFPEFEIDYHNTVVRLSWEAAHFNMIDNYEQLLTPYGQAYTGAGRRASNEPAGNRIYTPMYTWEGTILQKISDNWELRVAGQYFYDVGYGAQSLAQSYNWATQTEWMYDRLFDQRFLTWTTLGDLTGHYELGPSSWKMRNSDTFGWAWSEQLIIKQYYSNTRYPFSDTAQGIPNLAGQPANTVAIPMANETAALAAFPAPPVSSFLPFPGTSGQGTHGITWLGGYYYQHTISVVPDWFELIAGFSYTNIINDNVADVSQVPWAAAEEHYEQYLHRWGGVLHLGKGISIYALNANNIAPPSTATFLQTGQLVPPQNGTDNEVGFKTNLFNGRLSTDFTWFKMQTTNIPQNSGLFLPNGIQSVILVSHALEEGVDGDASFSVVPGWQLIVSFYAGHDRDQNNHPIAGTWDNSLGLFTRYDFPRASLLHGLTFGGGFYRQGSRWIGDGSIQGAVFQPYTVQTGEIKVEASDMVNAFGIYSINKHLDLKVSCANILNTATSPLQVANTLQVSPTPPTTYNFEVDYKF